MTSSFFARYESDFYEWSMQQAALVAEASVSVSLGPMAPYDGFKFRDSLTEMDSRFRGNDGQTATASVKVTCLAEMTSFPRKRESIT